MTPDHIYLWLIVASALSLAVMRLCQLINRDYPRMERYIRAEDAISLTFWVLVLIGGLSVVL